MTMLGVSGRGSGMGGASCNSITRPNAGIDVNARGFTLLEVVVALSILVVCMTVIMRILGSSSHVAAIGADYYSAVQIAESKMAELMVLKGEGDFIDTGTLNAGAGGGRFDWVVEVRPYQSGRDDPVLPLDIANDPEAGYQLYELVVSVFWGGLRKREYQLSTLHLRTKAGLE